MKKIVKVIGLLIFSAFLLLPLKINAQEAVWSSELNLSDSISSSIVKVEDGLIVMQYEGTASTNNLLIKYDFDGNKVWEINNEYGYNIKAVSGGFIVWNVENMTKFDLDKNVQWTKAIYSDIGNELIEVSDGYIIFDSGDYGEGRPILKINFEGELITTLNIGNFFQGTETEINYPPKGNKNYNGDGIFFLLFYRDESGSYIPVIKVYNDQLEFQKEYIYESIKGFNTVCISKVIPTSENSYIGITNVTWNDDSSNNDTIVLNEDGTTKILYKDILDIEKIGNYIYAYSVGFETNNSKTSIIKYDTNFKIVNSVELQLVFSGRVTGDFTGVFFLKNRVAYYIENEYIHSVVLNSPLVSKFTHQSHDVRTYSRGIANDKYNVASYRISTINENDENATDESSGTTNDNNNSGIIDNIIKNPETNSIILTIVVLLIILTVSIVSYRVYKNKITINNKSEKEDR